MPGPSNQNRIVGTAAGRLALVAALLGLVLTGCRTVPPTEQRLVSRPVMQFNERPAFVTNSSLLSQTEPGAAVSGGGANSGCTSCR